jgi:hypothetical protein
MCWRDTIIARNVLILVFLYYATPAISEPLSKGDKTVNSFPSHNLLMWQVEKRVLVPLVSHFSFISIVQFQQLISIEIILFYSSDRLGKIRDAYELTMPIEISHTT